MLRRSSALAFLILGGCLAPYDPIVICHNGNCAGTGRFEDDSLDGLAESLALRIDGRTVFDGVELDTYLYWDQTSSHCLFAHDANSPTTAATPTQAGDLVAAHLQQDYPAWNGDRFYLKLELKDTVAGSELFHTGPQLQQHAECVLDLVTTATAYSRIPVTVIFDTGTECLHNEVQFRLAEPRFAALAVRTDLEFLYSGPLVPGRKCIPVPLDIRTFYVHGWRDHAIEGIRPVMVWLDARNENTEALKINRFLEPEYVATSVAPLVRGWIEGYK